MMLDSLAERVRAQAASWGQRSLLFAALVLLVAAPTFADGPVPDGPAVPDGIVLERFFPAGVRRGEQVQIEAIGSIGRWPLKAWSDCSGLSFEPLAERGKLALRAAADAEPGLHWVRLYDASGTSHLRPMIVGNLPELQEHEPNNSWRAAQHLQRSASTINGRLGSPGDCDVFQIHAAAGQVLVAWIEAEPLGSPMDGVLEILDAGGTVMAENHDAVGLDPRVTFEVRESGDYCIRLLAFPARPTKAIQLAGGDDFIYRLTITTQAAVSHVFPLAIGHDGAQSVRLEGWNLGEFDKTVSLEPPRSKLLTVSWPGFAGRATLAVEDTAPEVEQEPNGRDRPNSLRVPGCASGVISNPGDEDTYSFFAQDFQTVVLRLESRELGFPLDGVLEMTDADGNPIATADDNEGRRDPELVYTVPLAGEYRVTVRDLAGHGGWRYAYRLRASLAEPDFVLKLGAGAWSMAAGSDSEIPVSIERQGGCRSTIRVAIAGLPGTASCPPVESQAEESSADHVTLKIAAGQTAFAGPIQVIGTALGERPFSRTAQADMEGFNRKTDGLWLTITPK